MVIKGLEQIGKGRKRIIIDSEINESTIIKVLTKAWAIHLSNVDDMKYLINYYKGDQDISQREPSYTSGINEKVTVNYAYSSVRDILGYAFGKPAQLIQRKVKYRKDMEKIADILEYENSSLADHETALLTAITGIGYLCTLPTEELLSDYMPDVPVKINSLDNLTTFCVQSPTMGNPTILSCTYYTYDNKTYFLCFTDDDIYRIECDGRFSLNTNARIIEHDINPIGLNPITMVQNNKFLMGDFEVAISVLNALNLIASDSVNDVENVIKSLLVIINAELNKENVDKVKQNRILELVGEVGANVDAKFIYQQLDSLGIQNLREYLEEAYKTIIGIPDRKTRGGGGGDTSEAVKLRDGWADIEIVARIKESYFKVAKKKQLAIIINILQKLNYISKNIKLIDLDVKLPRNKNDNLQSKAQSYSTIISTKTIAPEDALEMVDMTTDVTEVITRGKKYWDEKSQQEQTNNMQNNNVQNNNVSKEQNMETSNAQNDKTVKVREDQ